MRRSIAVLALVIGIVTPGSAFSAAAETTTTTVFTAPGAHFWEIPDGVARVTVTAFGAAGGRGSVGDGHGGRGGYARASIAVTPGTHLQINVGGRGGNGSGATAGAGGFNGGASGGAGTDSSGAGGGGGGGASDVRDDAFQVSDRLVVAGGGGGAPAEQTDGAPNGGAGGGEVGGWGESANGGAGTGEGGSQTGPGAGANGGGDITGGAPGEGAVGGAGGGPSNYAGGGGGGGYFGGGGGGGSPSISGGGGGGGSGYGPTNVTFATGVKHGHGRVTIRYVRPDALIRLVSDDTMLGNRIYNTTGARQTRTTEAPRGASRSFILRFQNDGNVTDGLRIRGGGGAPGFAIRYLRDGADVTTAVRDGTLRFPGVAPGDARSLKLVVVVRDGAEVPSRLEVPVTAFSTSRPTAKDTVVAVVRAVAG